MDIERFRKGSPALDRCGARRSTALFAVLAGMLALFAVQTFLIQTFSGQERRERRSNNLRRMVPVEAKRGDILDRNGIPIALDYPEPVRIELKPEIVVRRASFQEAARHFARPEPPPEVYYEQRSVRRYPHGPLFTHVTGYIGEVSARELKRYGDRLRRGEMTGKSGLEKWHDAGLSGKRGHRAFLRNSRNKILGELGFEPPRAGKSLTTTLDVRVQAAAQQALEGARGAVIVMESRTGGILALATSPTFDANLLGPDMKREDWAALTNARERPLLNRAIAGAYPPGSIFKILTAIAAFETGKASPPDAVTCNGAFVLGGRTFKCWKKGGHGRVSFIRAMAESCDVYFYTLALKVGIANLHKYAKIARLTGKTGIDLPGEAIGLIPNPEWKERFRGESWYPGDTVNAGIGQGYIQMTPMQALMMINLVAADGLWVRPHLADAEPETERTAISPASLKTVKAGLRAAVDSGTARALSGLPVEVAGKTGTAEDPPRKTPHAWFVSFAPRENPRISVAVFIENGGGGGSAAAPAARKIYEKLIQLGYLTHETVVDGEAVGGGTR